MIASSRPVNETGWKLRNEMIFGLSSAKRITAPTCSLLMPLMIVMTGTISTPALCRLWIAFSFTSNRLPTSTVRIGFVADTVELQIRVTQTGFGGLLAELGALRELDAVGRGLNAVVADLPA